MRAGLEIQSRELKACSVFQIMELVWIVAKEVGGKLGEYDLSKVKGRKCSKKEGGTNSVKCH